MIQCVQTSGERHDDDDEDDHELDDVLDHVAKRQLQSESSRHG